MRLIILVLIYCLSINYNLFAQEEELKSNVETLKPKELDTLDGWKKGGTSTLTFAQVSLSNWASGGQNSVSLNSALNLFANLKRGHALWENNLDLGFGLVKQNGESVKKSDDRIDFSSKYGRKIGESKTLYYAGFMSFRSQFAPGYNYPNDSVKISNFLAPAYTLIALGIDYKPIENLTLFFAPLTGKITFVNNQTLADAGAFGVEPAIYDTSGVKITNGKKIRYEFGGYVRALYKWEISKSAVFTTKLELFSNYVNNPQNIDVQWETNLLVKVGKYIGMTFGTLLIYDHDVMIAVDNNGDGLAAEQGPRVQFRQLFGLGFSYKFSN